MAVGGADLPYIAGQALRHLPQSSAQVAVRILRLVPRHTMLEAGADVSVANEQCHGYALLDLGDSPPVIYPFLVAFFGIAPALPGGEVGGEC